MKQIPLQQVLYYMGYKDQTLEQDLLDQIQACIDIIMKIEPKLTYRIFSKEELQNITFPGKDIQELIKPSQSIIFLACTLGQEIEKIMYQKEITNLGDAFILDACCNAAIENVCDDFEEQVRSQCQKNHLFLSDRFSPGYGDFPLSFQKTLTDCLQTSKQIGLHLTPTYLLTPRKSVTAICAISDQEYTHRHRGCEVCTLFMTCALRKRGKSCE